MQTQPLIIRIQTPSKCPIGKNYFSQPILLFSLFLLLFMGLIALFNTIYESHYTISATFFLYL